MSILAFVRRHPVSRPAPDPPARPVLIEWRDGDGERVWQQTHLITDRYRGLSVVVPQRPPEGAVAQVREAGSSYPVEVLETFGTGYSSLGYLRRFSFTSLKMDRSFVADLTANTKSLAVAQGLISLAHNLQLKVTAEGVETQEQLEVLRQNGCDQFQGYLSSRPVRADAFRELLEHRALSLQTGDGRQKHAGEINRRICESSPR